MRPNSKHWDPPFYERVQQSNRAKRPRLLKARGLRLYEIKHAPVEEVDNVQTGPWAGCYGKFGMRTGQISAFSSGRSYSVGFRVEQVEIRWLKPKQATLLRLQGASVKEVNEDAAEGDYKNTYVTDFQI